MNLALSRRVRRLLWVLPALVLPLLLVQGCAPATEAGNPAAGEPASGNPTSGEPAPGEWVTSESPIGKLAPDFTLADLDGNTVRLSDLRGKVVFLNFWTTWFPACRVEMPDIEEVYQKYRDQDVVVLGIDFQESTDTVRAFVEAGGYSWVFLMDTTGEVTVRYGIRPIPTSFFIDKKGIIRAAAIGAMTAALMEANLARAMGD